MNWSILFILSLPAVLMAALSLKGYTQGIELYLWLFIALFTITVVLKNVDHHVYIHLLLIGLFWGMINSLIQSLFFEMYLAHNSSAAVGFGKLPESMNPKLIVLLIGPATGVGTGMVMSGASYILRFIMPVINTFIR